jgi:rRNA-processing protein FCF1
VLKDSIEELKKLELEGVKDAKIALENVIKQKVKVLTTNSVKDVDEKILRAAKKQNAFIATNDKVLRKRAKQEGISTLAWNKSKKRLMKV